MPNANIIEIEACLQQLGAYCDEHPDLKLVEIYGSRIRDASRKLRKSTRTTDDYYLQWREEDRQDKTAWKKVAAVCREIQRMLERVGALEYPDQVVMYWDDEILGDHADSILAYLDDNREDLDFAAEQYERLERNLDVARKEIADVEEALQNYKRYIGFRRSAMSNASSIIGEFRRAMRRQLGRQHEDYQAIDWPYSIASDETVL
jgi:predicted ribosome quality control (RQC) complex YloA/Tae2 family protein